MSATTNAKAGKGKRPVGTGLKPRSSTAQPNPLSADEVQQQASAEPTAEGSKVPETGQALGVQNLESSEEPIVADGSIADSQGPEVPEAAIELAKAMRESREGEPSLDEIEDHIRHGETPEQVASQLRPIFGLGKQANGDFVVALTINEFYVESCKQFAEADKTTVEDWCSRLFNSTLEAYCRPNKGR